jgi:hypothetical protein
MLAGEIAAFSKGRGASEILEPAAMESEVVGGGRGAGFGAITR